MTKLFPSKQLNILITIILLTYTSLSAQENKLNSLIHIIENSSKYDKEKKLKLTAFEQF